MFSVFNLFNYKQLLCEKLTIKNFNPLSVSLIHVTPKLPALMMAEIVCPYVCKVDRLTTSLALSTYRLAPLTGKTVFINTPLNLYGTDPRSVCILISATTHEILY